MDTQHRLCCRCGSSYAPTREWANFCSPDCRKAFHADAKAQGGPMAPLVKAWIATRHAKPGSREAEICAFARRELTQMASDFNEADRVSATAYVDALMRSGSLYVDRRR